MFNCLCQYVLLISNISVLVLSTHFEGQEETLRRKPEYTHLVL